MDIIYDIWVGESLQEVIQNIAQFRLQVLSDSDRVHHSLSDEISYLTHYFDDEALIIVANDCGQLVGYMSIVALSEYHPILDEYSYYGELIKVSEGPIVHPSYRLMGVGKQLIVESINELELRAIESLILDTRINQKSTEDDGLIDVVEGITKQFDFENISQHDNLVYKKQLAN